MWRKNKKNKPVAEKNTIVEESEVFNKEDFVKTKLEPTKSEIDERIGKIIQAKKKALDDLKLANAHEEQIKNEIELNLLKSNKIKDRAEKGIDVLAKEAKTLEELAEESLLSQKEIIRNNELELKDSTKNKVNQFIEEAKVEKETLIENTKIKLEDLKTKIEEKIVQLKNQLEVDINDANKYLIRKTAFIKSASEKKLIEIDEHAKKKADLVIELANKKILLSKQEAESKAEKLRVEAEYRKKQSKDLEEVLKIKSQERIKILQELALEKEKSLRMTRTSIEGDRETQISSLELEIERIKQKERANLIRSNTVKRNIELLIQLSNEQLQMLANENNISIPINYTRNQKIEALKHVDALNSKALQTLLVLEKQKKEILKQSKEQEVLVQQLNEKKLWAMDEGTKIKNKFQNELDVLIAEEKKLNKTKSSLNDDNTLKMTDQEIDSISADLKKTLEIKLENLKNRRSK